MSKAWRLACALLLGGLPAAFAEEASVAASHKHIVRREKAVENAKDARAKGEVKSLASLLNVVEAKYLGKIIESDLDFEDGHWLYEFEVLPPDGRLFVVYVDAKTAIVARTEGPVQERH